MAVVFPTPGPIPRNIFSRPNLLRRSAAGEEARNSEFAANASYHSATIPKEREEALIPQLVLNFRAIMTLPLPKKTRKADY
jgi:hypothetical protein